MTRTEYLTLCLNDAISALDEPDLPMRIDLGNNRFIYPHVAIQRLKAIRDVDQFFPPKAAE